jgi:hypothetical protein
MVIWVFRDIVSHAKTSGESRARSSNHHLHRRLRLHFRLPQLNLLIQGQWQCLRLGASEIFV